MGEGDRRWGIGRRGQTAVAISSWVLRSSGPIVAVPRPFPRPLSPRLKRLTIDDGNHSWKELLGRP